MDVDLERYTFKIITLGDANSGKPYYVVVYAVRYQIISY